MNTTSVCKTALTSFTALLLVVLVSVSTPSSAFSGKTKEEKTSVAEQQVSVQYTSADANKVNFRIQFENPQAKKFTLIVKDAAGEVLYQQNYTDVHFNKTVQLLNDASEMRPTFVIRVDGQQVERSFSVSTNTTTEEKVEVVKM